MTPMLVNYIFRILNILFGAWTVRNAILFYKSHNYYCCGLMIMMTIYVAIYLFKISMET